jgi:hypothetical protein
MVGEAVIGAVAAEGTFDVAEEGEGDDAAGAAAVEGEDALGAGAGEAGCPIL